jgi:AraC-like DNA-binding protein
MPGFSAFYLTDSHPGGIEGAPARLVLSADAQDVVRDVTDRMLRESSQRPTGYKTALRGMLIELLVVLGRSRLTVDRTRIEPSERLAVVLSMLHERFFEQWSLSRMAEVAGCSIPSLSRYFRASLHTSPTEYLITVRINRAKQLLLHTDLSVTRIAEESGFWDSNYFTRQFKARTGRTPMEFRRGL